jgi:hypothetical protein
MSLRTLPKALAADFRAMNHREKRLVLLGAIPAALGILLLAAGGNWLTRLAGLLLILQQAGMTLAVSSASLSRRAYEMLQDRPRREMWRQN